MTLTKASPAVRYYIFLLRVVGNEPYEVKYRLENISNLCQFVRAIFFRTVGLIVAALLGLGAVLLLIAVFYHDPSGSSLGLLFGAAIVATVFGLGIGIKKFAHWRRGLPPKPAKPPSVLIAYIKAAKRGVCPLVKVELPASEVSDHQTPSI